MCARAYHAVCFILALQLRQHGWDVVFVRNTKSGAVLDVALPRKKQPPLALLIRYGTELHRSNSQ